MADLLAELHRKVMSLHGLTAASAGRGIETRRRHMEIGTALLPLPPGIKTMSANVAGLRGKWFIPAGASEDAAVLFFHGGAYALGSINTHQTLMAKLAVESGCKVLGVDYRLAPENPFPAAVEDAATAFHWLCHQGYPTPRIGVAGDSAGGGLSLAMMLSLKEQQGSLPAGAVLFCPWTDLSFSGAFWHRDVSRDPVLERDVLADWAAAYLNGVSPEHPLASPLFADLTGLPPLLIQAGGDELILDDATRLATRAEAAGVETTLDVADGLFHDYQFFWPTLPHARQAMTQAGAFIRERLNLPG